MHSAHWLIQFSRTAPVMPRLTTACELARYGVPIRIVEKSATRTDKSKALVIWSRTLELLDLGGGSAPFIDAGFKAKAVNIIAHDKVIGRVSMESVQSPYPYGLMASAALAHSAVSGASLMQPWE